MTSTTPIVYLNGRYVSAHEALVPVESRAFRFGDGVFETIRVQSGCPVYWDAHLSRLRKGLEILGIPAPLGTLTEAARELITRNKQSQGILRLSVSRGGASSGYLPLDMEAAPTTVMEFTPPRTLPGSPLKLHLSQWRAPSPEVQPSTAKLMQGVNPTLARLEALRNGCHETLRLSLGSVIAEAGAANIFWLRDYVLYTPAPTTGALEGITRAAILRLNPYKTAVGSYPLSELERADEVFLTNSACGVMAVASLHPQSWNWQPGPGTQRLSQLLEEDIANDVTSRCG